MNADSMVTGKAADLPYLNALAHALVDGALPDEIEGFGPEEAREAAEFVAACARQRPPGIALVRLESVGGQVGQRRMRLCVVNDNMPFLVDSVAGAIAAKGLIVHRLLHPVVDVRRDERGCLMTVEAPGDEGEKRESIMYLEVDRTDARGRQELVAELHRVLADVRASVCDWEALQQRMHTDADSLGDEEGSALLHWFADGAMTLLGYHVERRDAEPTDALGLLKLPGDLVWDEGSCADAIEHFQKGGTAPLVAKADRVSTVHRRVPFDLVVLPVREGDTVTGIAVHAGLWTSQAMKAPSEDVPVLRRRLEGLEREFGFDPRGHAGKALRHAVASLPRDLLVSLGFDAVKELTVTAMSLADRPEFLESARPVDRNGHETRRFCP